MKYREILDDSFFRVKQKGCNRRVSIKREKLNETALQFPKPGTSDKWTVIDLDLSKPVLQDGEDDQ